MDERRNSATGKCACSMTYVLNLSLTDTNVNILHIFKHYFIYDKTNQMESPTPVRLFTSIIITYYDSLWRHVINHADARYLSHNTLFSRVKKFHFTNAYCTIPLSEWICKNAKIREILRYCLDKTTVRSEGIFMYEDDSGIWSLFIKCWGITKFRCSNFLLKLCRSVCGKLFGNNFNIHV